MLLLSSVPDSNSPFDSNRRHDATWNQIAQLQLTTVITPAMVNSTNIAMNRTSFDHPVDGISLVSQIPGFHETLPFNGVLSTRVPLVTFSQGWSPQGIPNNLPRAAADLDDTGADDWSWLKGRHFLQAGINVVFNTKRQIPSVASHGNGR